MPSNADDAEGRNPSPGARSAVLYHIRRPGGQQYIPLREVVMLNSAQMAKGAPPANLYGMMPFASIDLGQVFSKFAP